MAEQEYFKEALSSLVHETASGGAIRHLADLGYTPAEITKRLTFPTPYERVRKTVWEYFLNNGTLLTEEPGSGKRQETFTYVTEYDQYGRSSFRRVAVKKDREEAAVWRTRSFEERADGPLEAYLRDRCAENGEEASYVSCKFGLLAGRDPAQFAELVNLLTEEQRDYVLGLPWERRLFYHRLTSRMREIIVRLYGCGKYNGSCYFIRSGEKVLLF